MITFEKVLKSINTSDYFNNVAKFCKSAKNNGNNMAVILFNSIFINVYAVLQTEDEETIKVLCDSICESIVRVNCSRGKSFIDDRLLVGFNDFVDAIAIHIGITVTSYDTIGMVKESIRSYCNTNSVYVATCDNMCDLTYRIFSYVGYRSMADANEYFSNVVNTINKDSYEFELMKQYGGMLLYITTVMCSDNDEQIIKAYNRLCDMVMALKKFLVNQISDSAPKVLNCEIWDIIITGRCDVSFNPSDLARMYKDNIMCACHSSTLFNDVIRCIGGTLDFFELVQICSSDLSEFIPYDDIYEIFMITRIIMNEDLNHNQLTSAIAEIKELISGINCTINAHKHEYHQYQHSFAGYGAFTIAMHVINNNTDNNSYNFPIPLKDVILSCV